MGVVRVCMVDDGDGFEAYREEIRTARKPHVCIECRRGIEPGERYMNAAGLYEGGWSTYTVCAHCVAGPCAWLKDMCGGYLFHGVREDVEEHRHETVCDLDLLRCIVGMRRKWRKRDGSLMAVPA